MWAGFIYVFDGACTDHLALPGLMCMSCWFQTQHGVGAGKRLAMPTTALHVFVHSYVSSSSIPQLVLLDKPALSTNNNVYCETLKLVPPTA